MKTALPILLLLVACGGRNEVHADCLTFHLDGTVDEAALAKNVVLARALMNPIVSSDDFCASFSGTSFEIWPVDHWDCTPDGPQALCVDGQTFDWGVLLNRTVSSLPHELFHVWDQHHGGIPMPDPHVGWDTNGRNTAADEFAWDNAPIGFQPL